MKTKLKDIANIQLGYSFRTKIQKEFTGKIQIIQMKDLTNNFRVNLDDLDKTDLDDYGNRHLMQKGDLIFKARGNDTTACFLENDVQNTILAAPLLKIRIK